MEHYKELPLLAFSTKAEWLTWLGANYPTKGVWLKFAKKDSGIATVSYVEAREVAIIYGWIDGLKNTIDEQYYALRFMPRARKSGWSKINTEIAEELIRTGKMHPAGLEQVTRAKADGRWENAYAPQSTITIPTDFQKELDHNPAAAEFFTTLKSAQRYAFLYRLHTTKRPEARREKIDRYIEMLMNGETFHPGN